MLWNNVLKNTKKNLEIKKIRHYLCTILQVCNKGVIYGTNA